MDLVVALAKDLKRSRRAHVVIGFVAEDIVAPIVHDRSWHSRAMSFTSRSSVVVLLFVVLHDAREGHAKQTMSDICLRGYIQRSSIFLCSSDAELGTVIVITYSPSNALSRHRLGRVPW